MVAVSASPPVTSAASRGEGADHAGLHQCADEDEQADEEQQGFPFDAAEVVIAVDTGDKDEQTRTEQRDDRGFDVDDGVTDERDEDQRQHRPAFGQQAGIADRLAFVQRHDVGDPVRVDREGPSEQDRQDEHEHHQRNDRQWGPCAAGSR